MNNNTLIVVCGYEGDAHQIEALRSAYEHHECPLLILSPDDAPILDFHGHLCIATGKRAYIGQLSLDRQHRHMLAAFEQPFDWFLFHDSDSLCLSAEIPDYLYERDDCLWSNEVVDFREPHDYHDPLPHVAFQPPYFMSRKVLRELVLHGKQTACPITPYIDWYMVQACYAAGLQHRCFQQPASYPTVDNSEGVWKMKCAVRVGGVMLHSIKTRSVLDEMIAVRADFLADMHNR